MSGIDVEALLDSTATSDVKDSPRDNEDLHQTERNERRDKDKYRDGSRDRDRDRDRKRRDRSREHRRDRDRDRDDDIRSPRSEHGSANGSHRSRRRSRSREDDRRRSGRDEGYHRRRSRSPGYDRYYRAEGRSRRDDDERRDREKGHRDRRRSESPKNALKRKTPEPQLTEDERDRRTVFVQQLAARLRTKELIQFFEKVGPVKEAQIVKDRVSGRSKGVGYVEFKDEDSVPLAIQMTGQKLLGIPIIAQLTEAEKNRQARNPEASSGNHNSVPFHRLYVGNIHFSITEQDLQNVFEPFGELEFVQLQKDETGRSRGYGFVQFRDPNQAREALEKMNGFDLAGRPIRVGLGNDKFTPESTANLLQRFQGQNHSGYQGSAFSGSGGRGAHAGGSGGTFDRAGGRDNDKGTGGASALDDTDVAGVNFNNYSRDALMRKLARTDDSNVESQKKTVVPKKESKPLPVNLDQRARGRRASRVRGEIWSRRAHFA
ncbi:hypothetical protein, variant [Exophiala oligosperma]|uniref:RRM domain-containing protein n=1 Tax=Exophiala oligosperma TaxID=215243 RepID=A0A0D2DE68_9EURO|nr:hypothetical protein, variant [Exophiala oligosperma]KIW40760.1 hypothetical protein, variant [Exophiala oligosperma]